MSGPRAFVLAGGQSRRMGRNKAQLAWMEHWSGNRTEDPHGAGAADGDGTVGQTLLEHALATLRRCGFLPGVAGLRGLVPAGAPVVPDHFPEAGPLGGIEAALGSLAAEPPQPVLFVPVDLPLLPEAPLRCLFARSLATGALATIPVAEGRPQPLCAVYHSSLAPGIGAALEAGDRKVLRVLCDLAGPALDMPRIEALAPLYGWDTRGWFFNVNTPLEYASVPRAARAGRAGVH